MISHEGWVGQLSRHCCQLEGWHAHRNMWPGEGGRQVGPGTGKDRRLYESTSAATRKGHAGPIWGEY